tara:strand:- start:1358 stop:2071 length:714 start_codon:yes stop_codon:yes gene_type:complete
MRIIIRFVKKIFKSFYLGSLRLFFPLKPIDKLFSKSYKFGLDRGTPIDRIYIQKFLFESKKYITGNILEVGDPTYTKQFGSNVESSIIVAGSHDACESYPKASFTDWNTLSQIPKIDCIIATQVLNFIYDYREAIKNISRLIKPSGVVLFTVSSISPISKYDNDRWGDYWRFTPRSISNILKEYFNEVIINSYGNSKLASAFIMGYCAEDMLLKDFNYNDPIFPITLTIIAKDPIQK